MSTVEHIGHRIESLGEALAELQSNLLQISAGDGETSAHLHECVNEFEDALALSRQNLEGSFNSAIALHAAETEAAMQTFRAAIDTARAERKAAMETAMSAPEAAPSKDPEKDQDAPRDEATAAEQPAMQQAAE